VNLKWIYGVMGRHMYFILSWLSYIARPPYVWLWCIVLVNDICTSYGVVCAWNTSTMTFWPHFFCKWVHNWGCHHLLWTLTTKLVFFQCLSTNHAMLVLFTFFFLVYRNPGWLQIWGHQGPFHTVEVKSLIKKSFFVAMRPS
jgi:hypothetical protein